MLERATQKAEDAEEDVRCLKKILSRERMAKEHTQRQTEVAREEAEALRGALNEQHEAINMLQETCELCVWNEEQKKPALELLVALGEQVAEER